MQIPAQRRDTELEGALILQMTQEVEMKRSVLTPRCYFDGILGNFKAKNFALSSSLCASLATPLFFE